LKDQEYIKSHNLVMVTKQGQVKKTSQKYSKQEWCSCNYIKKVMSY
jgi:hypothetical protein